MQNPSQISSIYNSCLPIRPCVCASETNVSQKPFRIKENGRNVFLKLEFSLRWTKQAFEIIFEKFCHYFFWIWFIIKVRIPC